MCIRNFTLVAGFLIIMSVHISVYIMYTVCNRRYTGSYVEGAYTEFYSCGRVPSSSGHMSVFIMYPGKIKGHTECGVEGICTDFLYCISWFSAGMKFVFRTLIETGFLGIQISDLKMLHN